MEVTHTSSTSAATLMVESFPLRLTAILNRQLEISNKDILVSGSHSHLSLALLLAQRASGALSSAAHVLILPNEDEAQKLKRSIRSFDPQIDVSFLPAFDVGPYSTLHPNFKVLCERLSFLHKARQARGGQIFIATAESLMQKTLPFKVLSELTSTLKKNDSLPDGLHAKLLMMGYTSVPVVEDVGTFSIRGSIVDIYSPASASPYRFELFGDIIDSIRVFDPATQRSLGDVMAATLIPAREALFYSDNRQMVAQKLQESAQDRDIDREELKELLRSISLGQSFYGMDFLLPYFYKAPEGPLEFFNEKTFLWRIDNVDGLQAGDLFLEDLKKQFVEGDKLLIRPTPDSLYARYDQLAKPLESREIKFERIDFAGSADEADDTRIEYRSFAISEFSASCLALNSDQDKLFDYVSRKFNEWKSQGNRLLVFSHSRTLAQRMQLLFEKGGFASVIASENEYLWSDWLAQQQENPKLIHIIPRSLDDSGRWPEENVVFVRDDDIWGRKKPSRSYKKEGTLEERVHALSFGDLKPGDLIVHRVHGVGIYEGLEVMPIDGVEAEYIRLKYKDNDRLFLPVYRVGQLQKFSGPSNEGLIDKLGGIGWGKTQTKVKAHLRDIADSLLKLYAVRAELSRPAFSPPDEDYFSFENSFPFEETEDQLRAINDVVSDFGKDKPMDRLICGDVGFGKTEVAMRAAFKAVQDGKQVAVVAPTTILTFQHGESFKKRFAKWPVTIRVLNRFISAADAKKTLSETKEGKVDILIGTHRLFSRDVQFKELGLLIIDEEQKFGVTHKEKIRQMRESVDTLAMSATPIPRTLNLSLVGIRDLSLINTPPEERLPTRTFVTKYDTETIRKGIRSELARGGQVFFLHNRVQSIDEAAAKIREAVPEARIAIGHGQMDEHQLESTMLKFFNHEVDVLVCTAIIESGMDIPKANTIFIDNAQNFGVSQLYQLRGRVGRSKERAYCYLLVPPEKKLDKEAQERVRIIQENTALGSGIRVAQYDLELRGAGDILGASQSGHINAVGYELYLELLEDAIRERKGEAPKSVGVEPEINLRIPALIPDKYIPDIRVRLSYYKALSQVQSTEDLDRIEDEFKDQFGPPPEQVINLMGLMLIRKVCRDLGVKDISAGKNTLTLAFTDQTPLPPQEVVRLSTRENKKFSITPDHRLKIRMNEIVWPRVHEELLNLVKLCPKI
jgi:transcription-repair coupling factor (superfamily II helicase)